MWFTVICRNVLFQTFCGSLEVNFTMVTQVVVLSVALCLICGPQVKNTQISQVSDEFADRSS